jgi:phenylpropionate dioxygenase-like ring-hydroxylating dioxygenase large terminal subunit
VQRTLDWTAYADPELLPRERERIFARSWQYVGHEGQLATPGYFASRVGDIPVVITRDRDGELRGFLNVCRHRGSIVAHGEGARSSLQCPYHAWTYALDGSLRAAPRADLEGGIEGDELSLRPVSVGTWGPFVFANPDPEAVPLAETLGRLPVLVGEAGVDVDAIEVRSRAESTVDANWKIVAENFLECYHCSVAHPGFSALVDVSPESYSLDPGETFSTQLGPVRADGNGYDTSGEVARSQFHFLWPNTMINIFPGRPNLSIGPVLPAGADRTDRFLDYFFAPDVDEAWVDELLEFDGQVGAEDRVLVENVQRGVSTGLIEVGRLLPESERLIADFQARVQAALA